MSIVPFNDPSSNSSSTDLWNPEDFLSLDFWEPFHGFPFPSMLSTHFPSFFPSRHETQVKWTETPRAHICRAVFPGLNNEEVLVYIDDDNMLQISTENGNFMSKFKLPENAKRDQIKTSMVNGVLTIVLPKEEARRPDVRIVEISGSD